MVHRGENVRNMNLKNVLLLLLASSANAATAAPAELILRHSPVPGGIAIVELLPLANAERPQVKYQNKRVMVIRDAERWKAIVGIPLETEPGSQALEVARDGADALHVSFTVSPKTYETQRLTIKEKRMVEPSAADLRRIAKESDLIKTALQKFREATNVTLNFVAPVEGRLSSPFGLRRFFNDQPRKPHSGLDLAAPKGTPIKAPGDGEVIAVGKYFFNGNTVILDHGQGLISMYSHMDRIIVKEGQSVAQGAPLGTVGMTGRVTGPHLHWTVSLNDTRVDPLLLFSEQAVTQLSAPPSTSAAHREINGAE